MDSWIIKLSFSYEVLKFKGKEILYFTRRKTALLSFSNRTFNLTKKNRYLVSFIVYLLIGKPVEFSLDKHLTSYHFQTFPNDYTKFYFLSTRFLWLFRTVSLPSSILICALLFDVIVNIQNDSCR
jgi:hypothetical protein